MLHSCQTMKPRNSAKIDHFRLREAIFLPCDCQNVVFVDPAPRPAGEDDVRFDGRLGGRCGGRGLRRGAQICHGSLTRVVTPEQGDRTKLLRACFGRGSGPVKVP
jgi:hypothetical protein